MNNSYIKDGFGWIGSQCPLVDAASVEKSNFAFLLSTWKMYHDFIGFF